MFYIGKDLQIDVEEILKIQEKYKNELGEIESKILTQENYSFKNDLYHIIESETIKYENSIIRDQKINKKNVGEYLEQFNSTIYNFIETEIKKQEFNIDFFIKKLSKLLFPKGIWGETMSPSGQKYLKYYESGKYRNTQEFISLGGTSYYFINPEEVESAIKNLDVFLQNAEILTTIKYVFSIFYFWNIHPFNDGNGAIARFLFPTIYLKSGYKAIPFEYKKFLIDTTTQLFYDKNNINYDAVISDFIQYIKNKES